MIMLKVTKNQGFSLPLKGIFFVKPQGGRVQIDPPVVLGLKNFNFCIYTSIEKQKSTKDLILHIYEIIFN